MQQAAGIHSCWISGDGREGALGDASLLFPYWSFTKTVIAICALKLFEIGGIDLDSRIPGESYTLRQLLNHTSGLPDYGVLKEYQHAVRAGEEPWSRERLLSAALAQGLLFPPGRGWSYSNIGYMLAREHIEAASGRSFACLFEEMIRDPLGLKSVELATTRRQFSRLCWRAADRYHPGWVYHGCLVGSARDAALLLHALFSGEVLNAATLGQMLLRYPLGGAVSGRPWTDCGYGLGLMSGSMGEAGRAIGHSGGGAFCVNAVYYFPDRDCPVTVASFTDGSDEGITEFEAARLALTE
ncbi:serine hydrolase domain-containing protein [Mesorhizobium sp. M0227]|uniref:serine hydrolase domain-containing protein n=1 Tax=unclassified Mesorhizobium TaxID=325217 RepID=UPI003336B2AF